MLIQKVKVYLIRKPTSGQTATIHPRKRCEVFNITVELFAKHKRGVILKYPLWLINVQTNILYIYVCV